MMRLRTSPLVIATLAVFAAFNVYLMSSVMQETASDDPKATASARWVPKLASPESTETQAKPSAAPDQDILLHPIFSRSRTPFVPPPPPPQKAPAVAPPVFTDPGFVLGGVMLNGQAKRAFLLQTRNHVAAWASEGDDVEGWTLKSITAEAATLQKESHVIELRLYPEESQTAQRKFEYARP